MKKSFSPTEENYIKAIYQLSLGGEGVASTNALAEILMTKPASVTEMLKKLAQKEAINYQKYQGVTLTEAGKKEALQILRKHRLWKVFLVDKLKFSWNEVLEVAEQLEHIQSDLLIARLNDFLQYPSYDPYGEPIPNEEGFMEEKKQLVLAEAAVSKTGTVTGVKDSSPLFLQYLNKAGIYLGAQLRVLERMEFDQSIEIEIDGSRTFVISNEVAKNIYITA